MEFSDMHIRNTSPMPLSDIVCESALGRVLTLIIFQMKTHEGLAVHELQGFNQPGQKCYTSTELS